MNKTSFGNFKILIGSTLACLSLMFFNCSKDNNENPEIDTPTTTISVTIYRSEFEAQGDIIYNLDDSLEGIKTYVISDGNYNDYFLVDENTGEIRIQNEILDEFNVVQEESLIITIGNNNYELTIVDMFDYFLEQIADSKVILDEYNETFVDLQSDWTAYNNLWGRGDAIPNQDFRIATIYDTNMPNNTVLIWDVPSRAVDYNGAAVWCYNNVFWGNRTNVREDLVGFPFQIQTINQLKVDFDFEQLYGNDQFKIAMNMFMTDESELTNFSNNDGDFFFVFDQKDTFIPNYSHTLPDIVIDGKDFAVRYDLNPSTQYERRRVIIKDNQQYLNGNLDVKALFQMFIDEGFLNPQQYIYHVQFGVEVTSGWGAIRIHDLNMNYE